jgi:MarR family transcriptional regulator, organic hydroperoxide resistance regulator
VDVVRRFWVLWVWGEMDARDFASAVGISRPTATGVLKTLETRGWLARRKADEDGRMIHIKLTVAGRRKIEKLFPKFNAEESIVAGGLSKTQQESLASMLRTLLRAVDPAADAG